MKGALISHIRKWSRFYFFPWYIVTNQTSWINLIITVHIRVHWELLHPEAFNSQKILLHAVRAYVFISFSSCGTNCIRKVSRHSLYLTPRWISLFIIRLDLVRKCPKMTDKPGKILLLNTTIYVCRGGGFCRKQKTTYTSKKAKNTVWFANRYYEHKEYIYWNQDCESVPPLVSRMRTLRDQSSEGHTWHLAALRAPLGSSAIFRVPVIVRLLVRERNLLPSDTQRVFCQLFHVHVLVHISGFKFISFVTVSLDRQKDKLRNSSLNPTYLFNNT